MTHFGPETYGDSFADVYDDWYRDISDPEATAEFVSRRVGPGPVLELGVGSGRLVRPLVDRGL
ncbi:MAG: class I SAM-dependent methyltransferase, partial [Actinomycetota bacterium]|nr:class I SAM-dependent methyltransferase [Actinomycetota bacterium]